LIFINPFNIVTQQTQHVHFIILSLTFNSFMLWYRYHIHHKRRSIWAFRLLTTNPVGRLWEIWGY